MSDLQLLTEKYVNLIGPADEATKREYADQVWDLVQLSYAKIGGIKGSGFNSIEDMIKNIPFWKLYITNGVLTVCVLYKDKGGKKTVAIGANTFDKPIGKKQKKGPVTKKSLSILSGILKADISRGYGEFSGPALVMVIKSVGLDALLPYIFTRDEVRKASSKLVEDPVFEDLNENDQKLYSRYPSLASYFYVRELGGAPHLKVMLGTYGAKVTVK
jgi:hypothetical protein